MKSVAEQKMQHSVFVAGEKVVNVVVTEVASATVIFVDQQRALGAKTGYNSKISSKITEETQIY